MVVMLEPEGDFSSLLREIRRKIEEKICLVLQKLAIYYYTPKYIHIKIIFDTAIPRL